jgi:hypothetical protein
LAQEIKAEITINSSLWQRVMSLDNAGPEDEVYLLDPVTGSVTFGDGVKGKRPPAGATIRAAYRQGGGESGNVASVSWSVREDASQDSLWLNLRASRDTIHYYRRQGAGKSWRWRLAGWLEKLAAALVR